MAPKEAFLLSEKGLRSQIPCYQHSDIKKDLNKLFFGDLVLHHAEPAPGPADPFDLHNGLLSYLPF